MPDFHLDDVDLLTTTEAELLAPALVADFKKKHSLISDAWILAVDGTLMNLMVYQSSALGNALVRPTWLDPVTGNWTSGDGLWVTQAWLDHKSPVYHGVGWR